MPQPAHGGGQFVPVPSLADPDFQGVVSLAQSGGTADPESGGPAYPGDEVDLGESTDQGVHVGRPFHADLVTRRRHDDMNLHALQAVQPFAGLPDPPGPTT